MITDFKGELGEKDVKIFKRFAVYYVQKSRSRKYDKIKKDKIPFNLKFMHQIMCFVEIFFTCIRLEGTTFQHSTTTMYMNRSRSCAGETRW